MFTFIGFVLVSLLALGATVLTILTCFIGGYDLGPPEGKQWLGPLFLACFTVVLWYILYTNSPFSVVVN